ncbi:MAG: hypothetical protein U5N86_09910 [Planctomycetota bacterium]|nr:hypothetical protein [Planctomycetota bacterium]
MPYLFGSIALAGLLIFSEYGIPAMLTVNTFVGELFAFMSGFLSASNAIVFSFLMFIIILVVGWFVFRKIPVTYFFSGKQSTHRHQTFKMRGWLKGISSAYVLLTFTLVVVVPFAALVIRAFSLTGDPKADGEIFSGFKYFLEGLEYGEQDFKTTLITAPLSAVLATIIALPIARMLAFTVKRIKYMLFVFVAMTFVIPATIFGIGVLMIYNLPMFDAIYDTPLIIVFTYVGMFTPIAVLILAAGMMRVGTREEFVARLHGVGNFTAYTDIFLPRIGFEFALAFLAVLVFSMAELGATALIMPPGSSPITTGLYIMMHYGNEERVSAIALMQIMLVFIPVIMFVNVRVLLKLARRNNG